METELTRKESEEIETLSTRFLPRMLDTFCKAGGATKGYQRSGWYVVGVDIEPQPHYCGDEFYQADALEFIAKHGQEFDAIHASPPCQGYSRNLRHLAGDYPRLIQPLRHMLVASGLPWVIENVPGSELRTDYILCGCYFNLPGLRRPRWFETSWRGHAIFPAHDHSGQAINVDGHGTPGRVYRMGQPKPTQADRCRAMGIDWMNRDELAEAIPPAFTEWIGRQLMAHLEREAS